MTAALLPALIIAGLLLTGIAWHCGQRGYALAFLGLTFSAAAIVCVVGAGL